MAHVPAFVCVECGREMRCVKNSHTLQMLSGDGPYYLIQSDRWGCPDCGKEILNPAIQPFIEHYQEGFAEAPFDSTARFLGEN